MNIVSKQFNESEVRLIKYIQDNYQTILAKEKQQLQDEESLMAKYSPCVSYVSPEKDQSDSKMTSGAASVFNKNLSGLKNQKLKQVINNLFYNPETMRLMACVSDVIFYGVNLPPGNSVLHAKIRQYFRKIRQFGGESVEGYALKGVFGQQEFKRSSSRRDLLSDDSGLFVLKVPRDPANNNLVHEMIVATYGTNKLRNRIPNFAYIYSGMKCSPPWIKIDKDVATFCTPNFNSGSASIGGTPNFNSSTGGVNSQVSATGTQSAKSNNVSYLLYENINPSKPFSDLLKTISIQTFLNYYIQLLLSLRMAYLECNFTHYDLHTDNVLVRDLVVDGTKRKVILTYQTPRGEEYMESDAIATIIDFGLGYIKYQDRDYGTYNRIPFSIMPDRPAPLFDAYKFLCFSIFEANSLGNSTLVGQLEKLFRFFNKDEPVLRALELQFHSRFSLPYSSASDKIDQFIEYVRTNYDCSFLSTKKPIVTIDKVDISPLRGAMGFVSLSRYVGLDAPEIKTIYDLNDYLPYLTNQAEFKRLTATTMPDIIKGAQSESEKLFKEYKESLDHIYAIDLSNPLVTLRYDTMIKYRKQLDYMAEVWDKFSLAKMLRDTINNVVTSGIALSNTDLTELNKAKTIVESIIIEYSQIFDEWNEQLEIDNKILDDIVKSPIYQRGLIADQRLSWYDIPRKSFKYVFSY